jgi:glycosyltransferase involved in cell wall biosynthesis
MKRLKLFVDAHVFDQEYQGSRTFIKEIYRELCSRDDLQVHMAAFDIDRLKKEFAGCAGIEFIKLRTKNNWKRLLLEIPSIIRSHDIDFAHFQYIVPPKKYCRYIVTIHDVIFEEFPSGFSPGYRLSKRILYKKAAQAADLLTTVSEFSRNSIKKFLGIPLSKIKLVPNGVNEKFFTPYDKSAASAFIREKYKLDKYILYVSRYEKRKNHAGLLRAWLKSELYKQGYALVLPGHKSLTVRDFDNLYHALPAAIKNMVYITDIIPDDDMLQLYRSAALFVYPSLAEGFGIPPLEAAAARIPVICSNTSAMEEYSFFGDSHIDCADTNLLAEKMIENISQPPSPSALESISSQIRRKYTWKNSASGFYDFLLEQNSLTSRSKQGLHDQFQVS